MLTPIFYSLVQVYGTTRGRGGGFTLPDPLGGVGLLGLIQKVTNVLSGLALALGVLLIVYGAFLILIAAGDPKKIETGKKTILYTVAGVAVVLSAGLIIEFVKTVLGVR